MQPVRKQSAARRATAGLAVANSREHTKSRRFRRQRRWLLPGWPEGSAPNRPMPRRLKRLLLVQSLKRACHSLRTAPRLKRLLLVPWPIWDALHPSILSCSATSCPTTSLYCNPAFRKPSSKCSPSDGRRKKLASMLANSSSLAGTRAPRS